MPVGGRRDLGARICMRLKRSTLAFWVREARKTKPKQTVSEVIRAALDRASRRSASLEKYEKRKRSK